MITNMPSLTWLWNLSGGWSLALLNKDPAVHWWPCFRRPQQTNESVVWYCSSSALLWDLAGTGLPVRRACLCGSVCMCVSRVYSAGQPYLKQNESLSLHYLPALTASLQPWRLINFLYTKTNRKDREHKTHCGSLEKSKHSDCIQAETKTNWEKWQNAQS